MKHALYIKFIAAYILFGILGFICISTLGSRLIERQMISSISQQLYKEATSIASSQGNQYYTKELDMDDFYTNLSYVASYQDAQIWLVSLEGDILLNTSKSLDVEHPETIKNFNPAVSNSNYYQIGKFYNYFNSKHLSVMVPVTTHLSTRGYIAMHYQMSTLFAQRESILGRVYLIFLAIYILSLLILGFFSFSVYKPLREIITGATEYASGNLEYNIPVHSNDEMGYLASSLNYMSDELAKSGEYQKKFIANVSHDFRSPLTSIKGYTEAMIDGTIPVEMQEKYLNIILFETERLNKLTKGLLTLNNMDGNGGMLDISTFDINAIIKNTAATFEGICRDKKISIELIFSEKSLLVLADMGKIQQVLYNLIDNAIKFSHKNSSIYVETTEKHGKVFISVKDTGIGIPKESVNKVWERFYKIDSSRGKDRKGTGLGLSIVKEIVNAHNQNINVISTEGVGTEFLFTLDKGR